MTPKPSIDSRSSDRVRLHSDGFDGFVSVRDLRASGLRDVPEVPGVYVFLREANQPPTFLDQSTGGHFKGRNPTVPVSKLQEAWLPEPIIVYIGKAGQAGGSQTLRRRLQQYLKFGDGQPVGHWGGRYVWQLVDAEDLVVCWRQTGDEEPRDVERQMLADFEREHGRLPFGNLKR